jgi:hypothetical protein
VPESPLTELTLIPVKRFMPSLSVRYDAANRDKIFATLADHLPYEERKPDLFEKFMHKIHF